MGGVTFKKLTEVNQLCAFNHNGFWHPMDTLRDKIYLEKLWYENKAPENLVNLNIKFWHNKKIIITGHTGFKGAWLSLIFQSLEAKYTVIL